MRGELTCPKCKETLTFGESGSMLGKVFRAVSGLAVGVTLSAVAALSMGLIFAPAEFTKAPDPVGAWARARLGPRIVQKGIATHPVEQILGPQGPPVGCPEEAAVRAHSADEIREAIDASSPITRSLAVQVAAEDDGPFHVEQVARIWKHVRLAWRYVNDPRAAQTITRAQAKSGIKEAEQVLAGLEGIDFVYFNEKDVVRHKLVQMIVKAYEQNSENNEPGDH